MRLPQILATEQLAQPRVPMAPIQGSAAAEGVADVGRQIAQLASQRLEVERAKHRQAAAAQGELIESQIELELTTGLEGLKRTETDPDEFRKRGQTLIDDIGNSLKDRTDNPDVRRYLATRLPRIFGRHQLDVVHTADGLWTDRQKAIGIQTEENYLQLIGSTPYADSARVAELTGKGLAAIRGEQNTWGELETAKREITFKHRALQVVATGHANTAPDDFLKNVDRYRGMDPKVLETLEARATAKSERLRKEADAASEKQQRKIEHEFHQDREQTYARLIDASTQGKLTLEAIANEGPRGRGVLSGEQIQHLNEMVTRPKDAKSDAATKSAVITGVVRGAMSPDEVIRLNRTLDAHGNPLLSNDDMKWALERHHAVRTTADPVVTHRNALAIDMANRMLATRGPLEAIDPKGAALRTQFDLHMAQRSKYYGGPLDPLEAAYEVLPGLATQLNGATKEYQATVKGLIDRSHYTTPQALKAAWDAKQISEADYRRQQEMWVQFNAAQQQIEATESALEELHKRQQAEKKK